MPGGSGCGQSELGEKSMKHRRILKCLSARPVSQHACTLLSELIGNYATRSLASSRRGGKKPNKNKPNQNTADCSMLPVGHLEGGKKGSLKAVCLAKAEPCSQGNLCRGRKSILPSHPAWGRSSCGLGYLLPVKAPVKHLGGNYC